MNRVLGFNYAMPNNGWFAAMQAAIEEYTANGWRVAAMVSTLSSMVVVFEPITTPVPSPRWDINPLGAVHD